MHIGLDFDNTIVRYDEIFAEIAIDAGFVDSAFRGDKRQLRDALRSEDGGEERWQWVQAQAYGVRLKDAPPFEGVERFVARCRELDIPLSVISHKTIFAAASPGGPNLREAATAWLERHFGTASFDGLYFEATRREKIARLASVACTHFIDDLEEVFAEDGFPAAVAAWLFDPSQSGSPLPNVETFASWDALCKRTEGESALWNNVEKMLEARLRSLVPCRGGGNNSVFRAAAGDRSYAIKVYGIPDDRERLRHEFRALRFLGDGGASGCVPLAIACDEQHGLAAYEWIEGEPVTKYGVAEVRAALALLSTINSFARKAQAAQLPLAADAALSGDAVLDQIGQRLDRFASVAREEPALLEFLAAFHNQAEIERRRFAGRRDSAAVLPAALRVLSPSDFGFHNAIRRNGSLVFVDFEYFGWDDPAKLSADFVLHPGMRLGSADTKEWFEGVLRLFGGDADFAARLRDLYPLFALKWCLIILNEFLPLAWERRRSAAGNRSWGAAKAEQLAKAWERLNRLKDGESDVERIARA